jgi:hypothetical protein
MWSPTPQNQKKALKRAVGRDVRFAIKDMELAGMMDENDFLNGLQPSQVGVSQSQSKTFSPASAKKSVQMTPISNMTATTL